MASGFESNKRDFGSELVDVKESPSNKESDHKVDDSDENEGRSAVFQSTSRRSAGEDGPTIRFSFRE